MGTGSHAAVNSALVGIQPPPRSPIRAAAPTSR
jgi:hypothetical protein